jgi:putative Mn2+ efflux pump MntP
MDSFTILAIALGLSFDTFAVSLSLGVVRNKILFMQAAEIATLLALFQGGLTILGYFLGSFISGALKATDHWVALLLLSFLGVKMIIEGRKKPEDESVSRDFNSRIVLFTMPWGQALMRLPSE